LDNSAVHPEAYSIVEENGQRFKTVNDLIANKKKQL
jgi:transcriptional accessory protein Tex/SPT6